MPILIVSWAWAGERRLGDRANECLHRDVLLLTRSKRGKAVRRLGFASGVPSRRDGIYCCLNGLIQPVRKSFDRNLCRLCPRNRRTPTARADSDAATCKIP